MLTGDEMQGSDSGISLQSRDEPKSRSAFQHYGFQKAAGITTLGDKNKTEISATSCLPQDLNDLPFDMPKLRRRKIIPQQVSFHINYKISIQFPIESNLSPTGRMYIW